MLDDETAVLSAVERDLVHHYQGHYRIVKTDSGPGANAINLVHQYLQTVK